MSGRTSDLQEYSVQWGSLAYKYRWCYTKADSDKHCGINRSTRGYEILDGISKKTEEMLPSSWTFLNTKSR